MEDSLDGLPPAIAVERSGPEIPPATIMEEIESQDAWIAVQEDPHACCICFDSFESPVLLSCGQGHFLCDKDIHQYCSENVFTKIFKMRESGGKVPCPFPGCTQHFDSLLVAAKLPPIIRRRYQNLLSEVVNPSTQKMLHLAHMLRDVLTLCCPSCKVAIDPYPDACSAVMCLNCSAYYCNFCFAKFDSMDSLKDRAESHEHASSHNTNESKDPFLPMDLVKSGQREFQKKKVMKYVELLLTLKEYAVDGAHIVALSLVICYEDMEMLDINPVEVWNACINAIMAPQIQNAPVAEDVALIGIREHATEGSEAPESRGAQLLAQAMLSGNNVAMKQILSSFRGSFDVNFIARSHIENENTQVVEYPLASLALVMSLDWLAIELIKAGANLFTKDNINGRTIIYIALEKGSKSVLQTMLETHPGLDLNQPLTDEDAGYSAMHIAARYDQAHLIPLLKEHGADVDSIEGEHNYTPLAMAIALGNVWAASALVHAGAKLNNISLESLSPFYIVAEKGTLHLLEQFVKRQPSIVNEPVDEFQAKAIHIAIKFKNFHFVQRLVSYGADINSLDAEDMSPLVTAIQFGDLYSAMFLIEQEGIDLFNSSIDERFPIYLIVERGHERLLQKALDRFPNLTNTLCTTEEMTFLAPIHVAIQCNQLSILDMLLRRGVDINITEGELKLTPIMLAAVNDNVAAFEMIISYKPSISEVTTLGRALLFILAERGHIDMIQMVLKHYTVDINAIVSIDGNNFTALHAACMFNRPQMVHYLLSLGADPMVCDVNGANAMHLAEQYGGTVAKQALLQCCPALEASLGNLE